MPKIFICAGEASGDYHGAALAEAIRKANPDAELRGMGGVRMRSAGVRIVQGIDQLNMMGLGVILHVRRIFAIMKTLEQEVLAWKPDALVFIDFPDFNLRLAKRVHPKGIHTVYFIPPKLWAWRSWRVRELRKNIDQLLVIFPFETEFYAQRGLHAEFVGNPVIDDCGYAARPNPSGAPVIGLVPGSRKKEIETLLPAMLDAVEAVRARFPEAVFRLPAATSVSDAMLQSARDHGVEVLRAPLPQVVSTCDFAWVASGTAALETALVETPYVVVYRVSAFTYQVGKRLIGLKHISLPNILAGKPVAPELMQGDVNGKRLAEEAFKILDDAALRAHTHQELRGIRGLLGEPGAASRAARAVLQKLGALSA